MKRRGLLLDRDGVINEDYGYISSFDRFDFKPEIFPFLRGAIDRGFRLAIVTNQSGVARGYYSEEDYENLTARIKEVLAGEGIVLDLVLASFTHPDGIEGTLRRVSFWRKPNPGMILEAAQKLNLDLSRSVMIGDKESDMRAALAAGVGASYWLGGEGTLDGRVRPVSAFSEINLC